MPRYSMLAVSLPIADPVLLFALVMLLVLLAPLIFTRLGLPGMVGLLLAGLVVGPHGLGLLERAGTVEVLGTVGLLYILFIAGLEVDLNRFERYRKQSIIFGLLSFGVPQVLGMGAALFVLGFEVAVAVLLGSIIASHTLLAYPGVSRLGLAKNLAVTTAVGSTIITDTAALLVLAAVAGAVEGELTVFFWLKLAALFAFYVGAIFWVLPRLGRWFFRSVPEADGAPGFVFVLAAVLTTAFAAELVGVEPIIGAFLAGLALNRLVPEQGTLMNRVQFAGDALFVPLFLISVGMLVDVRAFVEGAGAWRVGSVMFGALVLGKGLAALSTRKLFGYSGAEVGVLFGLTLAQAAATLAAVLVGFRLGLFDEDVLNGAILFILVTCVLSPWLTERYGRRVALAEAEKPYTPSEAPQRILVPLIEAEESEDLIEFAMTIRDPRSEQPLYPLSVAARSLDVEARVAASERLLEHAVRRAAAGDVPVVPLTRVDARVASGIGRAATEERITTVVLGWNGENTARQYTFGRVLDAMLEHTRVMLFITRLVRPLNTLQRVVVALPAFAEREAGFPAVIRALKLLASQLGAPLDVVTLTDRVAGVEDLAQRTPPEVPVTFVPLNGWTELIPALEERLDPSDLLVVVMVREGTVAWRPGLKRLPRLVPKRFPEQSVLFVYPSEVALDAAPAPNPPVPPSVEVRASIGVDGASWEEVVGSMLRAEDGRDLPYRAEAVRVACRIDRDYAPELQPGVALLHGRVRGLEAATLFVGISRAGMKLPRTAQPVQVVLVLLGPDVEPPEMHEQRLALVAPLVRAPDVLERLLAAQTNGEVGDVLADRIRLLEAASGQVPPAEDAEPEDALDG